MEEKEEFYNEGRPMGADRFERVAEAMGDRVSPVVYDTIVVGGGVAGCAAAIAASRRGAKVLLIEKMTMLGGLATAGMITLYLPLCDGHGNQVIKGLAEEIMETSVRYSYSFDSYKAWKEKGVRYETVFNGPAFALALEELVLSSGAEILYDTLFTGSIINDGTVEGIYTENKSGRTLYRAKVYVDASGDADIFARAGERCMARENSLAVWAYSTRGGKSHVLKRASSPDGDLNMLSYGLVDKSAKRMETPSPYFGDTAEGVNRFLLDSHSRLLMELKEDKAMTLASLPSMAQIRMTRRIEGEATFNGEDMGSSFPDSIGVTGDWRKPSGVLEIPYRSLYGRLRNVLAAGRCISAEGEAWEITRVIPPAAMTGEAAGTAAALASRKDGDVRGVDTEELRKELRKGGVIVSWNQVFWKM